MSQENGDGTISRTLPSSDRTIWLEPSRMDVRKTSGRVPEGEVARHDGQAVVTGPDKCVAHLPLMRRIRRAQIAQKYRRRFVGGLPSAHPDSPCRVVLPQITVMHGATLTPPHVTRPCAGRPPCGPRTTTPCRSN